MVLALQLLLVELLLVLQLAEQDQRGVLLAAVGGRHKPWKKTNRRKQALPRWPRTTATWVPIRWGSGFTMAAPMLSRSC